MSFKIIYKCDYCQREPYLEKCVRKDDALKETDILGIYKGHMVTPSVSQDLQNSNTHICIHCAETLVEGLSRHIAQIKGEVK